MLLNDDVLESTKPKVILLYRAHQSTLKSIINMGDLTGDKNGYVCIDAKSASKAIITHYNKSESQRITMGQYGIESANNLNYDLVAEQWLDLINNKSTGFKLIFYSAIPVAKRVYFSVMKKLNII
jgi:hypothetical protein